nr:hypothetical protein [uncultured Glaciecola sp.]
MYIGIVIPLKSKSVSQDWDTTCKNLFDTLNTVIAQSNDSYEVVVVGHEKPIFSSEVINCSRFSFIHFDEFPPPKKIKVAEEMQLKYESDRCSKILKGILHLSETSSQLTHFFALDADDLLHSDFIKTIQCYANFDCIMLDNGYLYYKNKNMICIEHKFSSFCGSSALLSKKLFKLPKTIAKNSYKEIPYGEIPHTMMRQRMVYMGINTTAVEEHVIMYVRDNGENISSSKLGALKLIRRYIKILKTIVIFTKKIKSDFRI